MQELDLLAIGEPLQLQPAGLRPVDETEWATAQRLPVKPVAPTRGWETKVRPTLRGVR
jgi:hypothetical protein